MTSKPQMPAHAETMGASVQSLPRLLGPSVRFTDEIPALQRRLVVAAVFFLVHLLVFLIKARA